MTGLIDVGKNAGWWWPHRGFVVLTDRPATLNDEVGWDPSAPLRRRLHNDTGPSVTYRDGWATWHWHGVLVPEWVITNPTIDAIRREENTEIRRCAIEHIGWDTYLNALDVRPVDTQPDPGNPGHNLRLYDLPDEAQLYDERVRLVVMDNASRDRDGTRRTFAETVPADIPNAVAAQAWAFDVDEPTYRALARAT